eukprot:Nk52_evm15s2531 gene=Nk52_evmTU15s2531
MHHTKEKGKLARLISEGTPQNCRGSLWEKLLDAEAIRHNTKFNYNQAKQLVHPLFDEYAHRKIGDQGNHAGERNNISMEALVEGDCELHESIEGEKYPSISLPSKEIVAQIELDIERTFPNHWLFEIFPQTSNISDFPPGLRSLFNLLVVYAMYNPAVGYCQGMSFVAAVLLMEATDADTQCILPPLEEHVFWCLLSVLEREKYLRGYYDPSLSRIHHHAAIIDKLASTHLPKLHAHLKNHQLHPLMYATQWLMRLFTSLPCWDAVLMYWDFFLLRGVNTIFNIAMSILAIAEGDLLQMEDMGQMITYLQNLPVNKFTRLPCVKSLQRFDIQTWEIETMEIMIQSDKEKEQKALRRRRIKMHLEKEKKAEDSQRKAPARGTASKWNQLVDSIATPIKTKIQPLMAGSKTCQQPKLRTLRPTKMQSKPSIESTPEQTKDESHSYRLICATSPRHKRKYIHEYDSEVGPNPHRNSSSPSPMNFSPNSVTKPSPLGKGVQSTRKRFKSSPKRLSPFIIKSRKVGVSTPVVISETLPQEHDKRMLLRSPTEQLSFFEFASQTPLRKNQRSPLASAKPNISALIDLSKTPEGMGKYDEKELVFANETSTLVKKGTQSIKRGGPLFTPSPRTSAHPSPCSEKHIKPSTDSPEVELRPLIRGKENQKYFVSS